MVEIKLSFDELNTFKNALNEVCNRLSESDIKVRLGVPREEAIALSDSIDKFKSFIVSNNNKDENYLDLLNQTKRLDKLSKIINYKAHVNFSINELVVLNNALNEVCHGFQLIDFAQKIGASHEVVKRLLKTVNKLVDENQEDLSRPPAKNLHISKEKTRRELTIREKCYLETNGYQVIFYLRKLESDKNKVAVVVGLNVNNGLDRFSVRSEAQKIRIEDLQHLIEYFEQHIYSLQQNPDNNSDLFLNCQTLFQVQALSGNFISEGEGSFTLRFRIKEQGNTNTYVDAEAAVTFKNIQSFTSSIQTVLT